MRLTRPLLIKLKTLILAITVGAVAGGDLSLHAQPMDLRESTSIFSRSQRNRTTTRSAPQPQSAPAGQPQSGPATPTQPESQPSQPTGSTIPQQNTATSAIQETSAFNQSAAESQPVEPLNRVNSAPPQQEPMSVTIGGASGSTPTAAPAQPAPEAPLILPLPNWEDSAPRRPSGQQAAGNYVLSPNDYIQINVFQENDLHTETRIADDGTINFPLIGVTKVGGRTVNEAVELIRRRLDADYIVNPQVTLTIVTYSMGRFTILGEVARPGSYDLPRGSDITLLDAIGSAGGFTRTARESKVTVKRNVNGKEEVITLDAKRMANKGVQPFVIRDGDTINVPTTFF